MHIHIYVCVCNLFFCYCDRMPNESDDLGKKVFRLTAPKRIQSVMTGKVQQKEKEAAFSFLSREQRVNGSEA